MDGAYVAAYDAYRMAAEALLARQALRATGGDGSHMAVEDAMCFMQKFALCNEPAVVAGRSPAPIARAGPKGLHSRVGFA